MLLCSSAAALLIVSRLRVNQLIAYHINMLCLVFYHELFCLAMNDSVIIIVYCVFLVFYHLLQYG